MGRRTDSSDSDEYSSATSSSSDDSSELTSSESEVSTEEDDGEGFYSRKGSTAKRAKTKAGGTSHTNQCSMGDCTRFVVVGTRRCVMHGRNQCAASGCKEYVSVAGGTCEAHTNTGGQTPTMRRCGAGNCSRYIVVGTGHCVVHGPVKRCTHMRCSRNALPNEDVCDVHTVQRQCVVTGCPKIANKATNFCPTHSDKRPAHSPQMMVLSEDEELDEFACKQDGCEDDAEPGEMFCAVHSIPSKCRRCSAMSVLGSTACHAHGGAERCEIPGCLRYVVSTKSMCVAHAQLWQCEHEGCQNTAIPYEPSGAKLCEEHQLNPSPRCNRDGCTRFAIGGKSVCVAHSNLQACKHPDCPRVAPVGKMLCEPHFKKMGQKCDYNGCNRYTVAGRPRCVIHIGERKCIHSGCNLMPAGRQPYCEDHGESDDERPRGKKRSKAGSSSASGSKSAGDTCSEKRCGHPVTKRGMCSKHYKAHKQRKEAEKERRELLDEDSDDVAPTCSERRCLDGAVKRGLCSKHYKEYKAARKAAKAAPAKAAAATPAKAKAVTPAKASEGSARKGGAEKGGAVGGGGACTVRGCSKRPTSGSQMCRAHADASAASMPPAEPAVIPRTTRGASASASASAFKAAAFKAAASRDVNAAVESILDVPSANLASESDPMTVFNTVAAALGLDVASMPPETLKEAAESLNSGDPHLFLQHLASAASVSQCSTSGNASILQTLFPQGYDGDGDTSVPPNVALANLIGKAADRGKEKKMPL